MDTIPRTLPLRRWLALSLVVLLAHLGLLQSMPLALNTGDSQTNSTLTFATRSIEMDPPPAQVPVMPTAVVSAKPKTRPSPKTLTEASLSVAESARAAPENKSTEADTSMDPTGFGAGAALLAAAPARSASSSPAPQEPKEPAPSPQPPREKSPRFSAESLNGSTRLIYKVHANKFPFSLSAELLWRNLGDNYSAKLSYSAFGQSRSQTSRGQITDVGLAPERFADKYRSEVAAHFNRAQGKVTFSANTPDAPLLVGAQDRLSVLVQLGALVASEPARYGPGTTLTIQTIGPRDADMWLFTFEATETLDLPGGQLQGLKLARNPRQPYDQKVEVWLAPKLGYLPARIRITETNGDAIDQQWASSETVSGTEAD